VFSRIPIVFGGLRLLFFSCLLLSANTSLSAQCSLSCNQGLNVSLDQNGQAAVTTSLIAPNAGSSCPGPLEIKIFNEVGQQMPNPLTCDQVGLTLTARVRQLSSGNFCTGTLTVFDAIAPTLTCADQFVFCNEDPSPANVGEPSATDNCTPFESLTLTYVEQETALGCNTFQNGQQVLKRINRTWRATDENGNSSTCVQKIWLKHIGIGNVIFPPNHDGIAAPSLACGQDPTDLALTGQPTVNGVPLDNAPECEIAATHSDQTLYNCPPADFTVLRTWTVIDFCVGSITNRTQIIKVEDKTAPLLTPPADLTIGMVNYSCTGIALLPQATATDNCSAFSIQPSWEYGTGYGPFQGVPEGEHIVTYTATDACGNSASATMRLTVVDDNPPQAICSAGFQVSLLANGVGYINATALNAGSSDNCGPVFFGVSRTGLEFTQQVEVSCADMAAPVMLTLRVLDIAGLENYCEVPITVRDFLKPVLQCPANATLTCLQDYTSLQTTGVATATDNCAMQSLVYQDLATVDACNIGSVSRTWTATDASGNSKTCVQQITLSAVNTTTVTFPPNVTVNSCTSASSTSPLNTGAPILGGQACSARSVTYTDQIFNTAPPACYRVVRNWKVIDHCIYDVNGTMGIWEQAQLIEVVDNTPPVLTVPDDLTLDANQAGCNATVTLLDAAATDCSTQITWTHDSPYALTGGANASGLYPLGTHFVTFTANDGCGNSAQKTTQITVRDGTPPLAACVPTVQVSLSPGGTATLNAGMFNAGSSDVCSPSSALDYTVSPSSFDCQSLGVQLVTLTVRDAAGNVATCVSSATVQAAPGICNTGGGDLGIGGSIRTEMGTPVHYIPVSLTADGFAETTDCDSLGKFLFEDVPPGNVYRLRAGNNANWLNGVSTFDLVLMSKHILSIDTLDSPFKIIAADANRSGSVTSFDIVQLRKLILGIFDSVPNNTSWRFVDSTFVFPDPINPFGSAFPEEIQINNLSSNQLSKNFVGIKIGDLNNSTDPATARAPHDTLFLALPNVAWAAGDTVEIPIALPDWESLEGFQFELEIGPSAVLERVECAHPAWLGPQHIALRPGGRVALSWDNALGQIPPSSDGHLLTLHLRASESASAHSALRLRSERLTPEAYLPEKEGVVAISLRAGEQSVGSEPAFLRLMPNPTSGSFSFENPLAAASHLRILDARGQLRWEKNTAFERNVSVPNLGLPAGLYFVEISDGARRVQGKLGVQLIY
jgi:hypothetical protein